MPAPSPWVICLPRPDGQQDCQDIPALLRQPDPDMPDPVIKEILDQIGRLQDLAAEVQELEFKMQLTQALDGAVARIGSRLPAGYEFRRAARRDLGNEFPGESLPDVTGLFYVQGWNILHNLGYVVTEKFQRVFAEKEDGLIISEDLDPAGVDHVILGVGVFLPEPPHIPDQVPIIE